MSRAAPDPRPATATPDAAPDSEPAPPRWSRWFTVLSLAAAAVALVITVVSVGGLAAIGAQLAAIGPWFAALCAIEALITCCDAASMHTLLRPSSRRLRFRHVVAAQVAGRAVNAVTPMAALGEGTKMTMLMQHVRSSQAIAAVVFYNLGGVAISLGMIALGAPICALVLPLLPWMQWSLAVAGLLALVGLLVLWLLVRRGMLSTLATAAARIRILPRRLVDRWRDRLIDVDRHLQGATEPQRVARRRALAWLIASRALGLFLAWVVLAATGYLAGIGTIAALATAYIVINWVASIVPMGLGITEGANATLFAALGASPVLGVTLALVRRILQLVYAAIGLTLVAATGTVKGTRTLQHHRRTRLARTPVSARR